MNLPVNHIHLLVFISTVCKRHFGGSEMVDLALCQNYKTLGQPYPSYHTHLNRKRPQAKIGKISRVTLTAILRPAKPDPAFN